MSTASPQPHFFMGDAIETDIKVDEGFVGIEQEFPKGQPHEPLITFTYPVLSEDEAELGFEPDWETIIYEGEFMGWQVA